MMTVIALQHPRSAFEAAIGLVAAFGTDEALWKAPSHQRILTLGLGAIVLQEFKQAVAWLELYLALGHDFTLAILYITSV